MFSVGNSGEMKPTGRIVLRLSVSELCVLCNQARDIFHSQDWPVDAKISIVVPDEESFKEWAEKDA